MDLSTTYMGLELKNPVVPSASPLARKVDWAKKMEDAGAAAVTLHSLFEEQIRLANEEMAYFLERGTDRFAESLDYFPETYAEYKAGPEQYLDHIRKLKDALDVPVIASLNGSTMGGWTDYARQIEEAGADALEVNLYQVAADPETPGSDIEQGTVDVCKAVCESVSIPVAMKLSPYFSSTADMARRLEAAGAKGLVLFNRFYQPVIDLETLEVRPDLVLSTPYESRLPLRWVAILFGRIKADMALTSGVHTGREVVQALMAGAAVANVCSVLLKQGPGEIEVILRGLRQWLEAQGYESVGKIRGILSQKSSPDPAAFERANYMKTLASFEDLPTVPH